MSTVFQTANKIVGYESSILLVPDVCSNQVDVSSAVGTLSETLSQLVLLLVYLQNMVIIYQTVTFTNLLIRATNYCSLYFPIILGKHVKISV
jgi:hypothetical protein